MWNCCTKLKHLLPRLTLISPRKTLSNFPPRSMATWTCSKCTFANPSSQKPNCLICLSPSPSLSISPFSSSSSPSSSSAPKWACKACTFLNPYQTSNCEICGTRASSALSLRELDEDELESSAIGSVFLPLQACIKRKDREESVVGVDSDRVESGEVRGNKAANKGVVLLDDTALQSASKTLKILSYNVWFREDLEMHKRMKALGDLIQMHSPDLICLQEVTPNIYDIFQQSSWWKAYSCSVANEMAFTRPYFCMQLSKLPVKSYSTNPFRNSIMGRELCVAEIVVREDVPLVVATSHLESPCPAPPKFDQMFSKERVEQAKEAINSLKKNPNVIFCGDMNWDDKLDRQFPLQDGWVDAWAVLRPGESGWTYDTKSNQMLSGNRTLQKRLDRFVCHLRDFKVRHIDMIGMEAIPGLSYCKDKKVKNEVKKLVLPVLPSDHYGLLLTISTE